MVKFTTQSQNLYPTLKYENIVLTSSSNPISIILSASSIHRYLHTSSVTIFLSNMSISRPGVATRMCTPLQINKKKHWQCIEKYRELMELECIREKFQLLCTCEWDPSVLWLVHHRYIDHSSAEGNHQLLGSWTVIAGHHMFDAPTLSTTKIKWQLEETFWCLKLHVIIFPIILLFSVLKIKCPISEIHSEFDIFWKENQKCWHSLTEGQMMRPYGPSSLINGNRFSCSRQNMSIGSVNTMVFPEPVNAIPIISLPASLQKGDMMMSFSLLAYLTC